MIAMLEHRHTRPLETKLRGNGRTVNLIRSSPPSLPDRRSQHGKRRLARSPVSNKL